MSSIPSRKSLAAQRLEALRLLRQAERDVADLQDNLARTETGPPGSWEAAHFAWLVFDVALAVAACARARERAVGLGANAAGVVLRSPEAMTAEAYRARQFAEVATAEARAAHTPAPATPLGEPR